MTNAVPPSRPIPRDRRVWPSFWNGADLPYRPPVPIVLFTLAPVDPRCGTTVRRVVTPDPLGNYWKLEIGAQYFEEFITPRSADELRRVIRGTTVRQDAYTQVDPRTLPPVPLRDVQRMTPPHLWDEMRRFFQSRGVAAAALILPRDNTSNNGVKYGEDERGIPRPPPSSSALGADDPTWETNISSVVGVTDKPVHGSRKRNRT